MITLRDGRTFEEIEEHNRGSAENPMTDVELRAKFDTNAAGFLDERRRDELVHQIFQLERVDDASRLVELAIGGNV